MMSREEASWWDTWEAGGSVGWKLGVEVVGS